MSDPTPSFTRVRKEWRPYNYSGVRDTLANTRKEFGFSNHRRWHFWGVDILDDHGSPMGYAIDFYFSNPHDAMIFALKYLE